jgi:hypothetical protein
MVIFDLVDLANLSQNSLLMMYFILLGYFVRSCTGRVSAFDNSISTFALSAVSELSSAIETTKYSKRRKEHNV